MLNPDLTRNIPRVHYSDPHNDESFASVKALASQYHHIDLTLLTGDLSQDHSEASYQKCREVFRERGRGSDRETAGKRSGNGVKVKTIKKQE